MNDEMVMMGVSGMKCKPQYSERMLNVFNPLIIFALLLLNKTLRLNFTPFVLLNIVALRLII